MSGLWQLAQACRPEAESDVSEKIFSPSAACADNADSAGTLAIVAELPPPPHAVSNSALDTTNHVNGLRIGTEFPCCAIDIKENSLIANANDLQS